jgi:hypothetical protein
VNAWLAIAMLTALVAPIEAQSPLQTPPADIKALKSVRSLRCMFVKSTYWDFRTFPATLDPVEPDTTIMVFDAIDHAKNHARMVGNIGATDVVVIDAEHLMTFLEVTNAGNPMVTVVFGQRPKGLLSTFVAITSRHQMDPVVNLILAGQMVGSCTALE